MKITIKRASLSEYHESFINSCAPAMCALVLDCTRGRLSVRFDRSVVSHGSIGMVFGTSHKWTLRMLNPEQANALLQAIKPLAQAVQAGFSTEKRGTNTFGVFSDAAKKACESIAQMCDEANKL